MSKELENRVRLFAIANSITENELDRLEKEQELDLGRKEIEEPKIRGYYLQFEAAFRKEAKEMSQHYEVFYCLEKSIRSLIVQLMEDEYKDNWWEDQISEEIKKNVEKNIERESDSGFTQRSEDKIDYTTFGELSQIVNSNWDAFNELFRSKRAFQKIMNSLNLLRGPIAHCTPLAEDEIVRLELTVKDWFRLMEYK
ncbi:MAG: Swt1 family HEPN domain-containing protein [Bacteroidia bacterium]